MTHGWRHAKLAVQCLIVAAGVAACASPPPPPPKPTVIQATIDARPSTNPDARGRPSPVVMRFYELKSLAAFSSGDFFSLFDRDKETLAAEMVAREEFQLSPGEQKPFERKLQPETRYIAVVAAFRDLDRAQWRASMPVVAQQTTPVVIKLEASTVTIAGR
jgi:type VI secretion system protein VasD